jgi:hypothetical protein
MGREHAIEIITMSALPEIDPKAAAVDIGSEEMHVSIAGGVPKVFGSTTAQLQAMRDYLLSHGVHSVAMEATGVYWLCPYEVLEKAGLEVLMVNGKYVKNLPDRHEGLPMAGHAACARFAQSGICPAGAHPTFAGLSAFACRSHRPGR